MPEQIDKQTFSPLLNQKFQIHVGEVPINAELVDVSSRGKANEQQGLREPFSLLFRTEPESLFGQGNYLVTHPELDDMAIFLVPNRPDDAGMYYEAIFS